MRDTRLREAKAGLRKWFRRGDMSYLTRVVDECRAGLFCYTHSCHCLRGLCEGGYYGEAAKTKEAFEAERALLILGGSFSAASATEHLRRIRTLPIVLAEIRRRRVREPQVEDRHEHSELQQV